MSLRKVHRFEQHVGAMNVTVGFVVRSGSAVVSALLAQQAMILTSRDHPVLRYCVAKENPEDPASPSVLAELSEEQLKFDDGTYVRFTETAGNVPDHASLDHALIENARLPAESNKTLFVLHVNRFDDGCTFHLVIHHGFTDGTSIFYIVDSFCNHLAGLLSGESKRSFEAAVMDHPIKPMRDLVAEILEHPRVHEPEDPRLNDDYTNIAKFPKVTDATVGRDANGCIRSHFLELDSDTTAAILANCRRHKVSFQSLLSGCAVLAFLKLRNSVGELDEAAWAAPIVHMVPVNLRRYLESAEGISAGVSGSAAWKQLLRNADQLAQRMFWTDFLALDVNAPLNACLSTPFPMQFVHRLNEGKTVPPMSVMASSVGNMTVLQQEYGCVKLEHVFMQAGFYAASMEAYKNPAVPPVMINSGAPGFVMIHAYSLFGALHLSGSYFGYSADFIKQYYDEVMRLLRCAATVPAENAEIKIGDIFHL